MNAPPAMHGDENPTLTFVVPVYNERETIRELVERCRRVALENMGSFRMVVVDDGSTDGSRELLRELAAAIPGLTVLLLRSHLGKSAALAAGFTEVHSGWVVTLDADLQDQPEELPALLRAGLGGADLVTGRRVCRQDRLGKRISSTLFNLCCSLFAGTRLHDCNSGYKLIRADVARRLRLEGSRHRLMSVLARWEGFRVAEVAVSHQPRRCGRSKYGPFRPVAAFFDLCSIVLLEKFRHRPLHFFGSIGAVLVLLGTAAFAYLFLERLLGHTWVTNRPLFYLGALLVVLGTNFFTTGLLAEFQNAQNPPDPSGSVGERIGSSGPADADSRELPVSLEHV